MTAGDPSRRYPNSDQAAWPRLITRHSPSSAPVDSGRARNRQRHGEHRLGQRKPVRASGAHQALAQGPFPSVAQILTYAWHASLRKPRPRSHHRTVPQCARATVHARHFRRLVNVPMPLRMPSSTSAIRSTQIVIRVSGGKIPRRVTWWRVCAAGRSVMPEAAGQRRFRFAHSGFAGARRDPRPGSHLSMEIPVHQVFRLAGSAVARLYMHSRKPPSDEKRSEFALVRAG